MKVKVNNKKEEKLSKKEERSIYNYKFIINNYNYNNLKALKLLKIKGMRFMN